jgi:hypothetical protein
MPVAWRKHQPVAAIIFSFHSIIRVTASAVGGSCLTPALPLRAPGDCIERLPAVRDQAIGEIKMERHELEAKMDELIAASGVDLEDVISPRGSRRPRGSPPPSPGSPERWRWPSGQGRTGNSNPIFEFEFTPEWSMPDIGQDSKSPSF